MVQSMGGLKGLWTGVIEHGWVRRGMGSLLEVVVGLYNVLVSKGQRLAEQCYSLLDLGSCSYFTVGLLKEKALGSISRNNL